MNANSSNALTDNANTRYLNVTISADNLKDVTVSNLEDPILDLFEDNDWSSIRKSQTPVAILNAWIASGDVSEDFARGKFSDGAGRNEHRNRLRHLIRLAVESAHKQGFLKVCRGIVGSPSIPKRYYLDVANASDEYRLEHGLQPWHELEAETDLTPADIARLDASPWAGLDAVMTDTRPANTIILHHWRVTPLTADTAPDTNINAFCMDVVSTACAEYTGRGTPILTASTVLTFAINRGWVSADLGGVDAQKLRYRINSALDRLREQGALKVRLRKSGKGKVKSYRPA